MTNAGRIGIGTATPQTALDLYTGTMNASSVTTTAVNLVTSSLPASPTAGEILYNGTSLYSTVNTSNGRGFVPVRNIYYLQSDIGPYVAGNYFFTGGSSANPGAVNLAASSTYEVEYSCIISKPAITGTISFSLVATGGTPVFMGGALCAGAGANSILCGRATTTSQLDLAAGASITAGTTGIYNFKVMVITSTLAPTLALKVTALSGTGGPNMTSVTGSYYTVTQIPRSNFGSFTS